MPFQSLERKPEHIDWPEVCPRRSQSLYVYEVLCQQLAYETKPGRWHPTEQHVMNTAQFPFADRAPAFQSHIQTFLFSTDSSTCFNKLCLTFITLIPYLLSSEPSTGKPIRTGSKKTAR
ncbi:MAG: hypothetical protein MJZ12_04555 [Prevotella sp.]|nr:hypothetical protein [Prevotella sp.]